MSEHAGSQTRRAGFVAILGAPNAGKSTLTNRLVGAKVSIVTPKVQTTRRRITGIVMAGDAQIILVDTPGIFAPRRRLDRAMVDAAWAGARDADLVVLLVDAQRGIDDETRAIAEGLAKSERNAILALNKIDRVRRPELLALADQLNKLGKFTDIFMISAETGDGVADLRDHLARNLPEGPWLYDPEQVSDLPERFLASETTREKLFLNLHQELPYQLTVETEAWTDNADGSVRIDQVIYVQRENHKPIVLGKGGQRIKAIGAAARAELETALERRVHLFLHVKVREGWAEDPARLRAIGLEPGS
ncbi:MAG: GTPase Era [Alphaproteobacteria bacterium]|nr:GTPase Era [Alphaproteobacteria bacterium]